MKTSFAVLVFMLTISGAFADATKKSSAQTRKPAATGGEINVRIADKDTYLDASPIVTINPTLSVKGLLISGTTGGSGPVECLVTPELASANNVELVTLAKEITSNPHVHFECMRSTDSNKATWFKVDFI